MRSFWSMTATYGVAVIFLAKRLVKSIITRFGGIGIELELLRMESVSSLP